MIQGCAGAGTATFRSFVQDVDKKKRSPGDQPIEWPTPEEASHAVREYLAALDAARHDAEGGGGDGQPGCE